MVYHAQRVEVAEADCAWMVGNPESILSNAFWMFTPASLHPPSSPRTAHVLRIQTSHVTGPASSSVNGRPATLRASFI